jgi:ABC-type phosphate transport system substrate-binding protein
MLGGSLAGAAVIAAGFAMPAGAVDTPGANTIIVGTGSSTTYSMMQQLDVLFNSAPGCQQFVPFPSATTPQNLDFECVAPPTVADNPENPFNDVSVQEPALGSSNGIAELEDSGAHGATATNNGTSINVFQGVDYARSSRDKGTADLQGLNFVAYARDGVSWFHYTSVKGTASASAGVTNLSQNQLQEIYDGQIDNWSQVGGASAPIVVFSAQEGSGTQSTWKTFLGFDPVTENTVNCKVPSSTIGTAGTNCVGPGVIFENEDAQIATKAFSSVPSQATYVHGNAKLWGTSGGKNIIPSNQTMESDGIFFFSFGKYSASCARNSGKDCGGSLLQTGTTNALGQIGGVTPNESNILRGTFPVDRFLYNVYSNGSNSNIPQANGAALNYVSEQGFICKPQNATTLDPATGKNYLAEIQSIIETQGFFPLSGGMNSGTVDTTTIDEGSVPHPASSLAPLQGGGRYAAFDAKTTDPNTGDPDGYCEVFSTDGNANS